MFDIIADIIGYSGSGYNNYDSVIIYICGVIVILAVTLTIDMLYKLFLRFIPKDSK